MPDASKTYHYLEQYIIQSEIALVCYSNASHRFNNGIVFFVSGKMSVRFLTSPWFSQPGSNYNEAVRGLYVFHG